MHVQIGRNDGQREQAFEDGFPICGSTDSVFRVFSASLTPAEITERLGLEPSRTVEKARRGRKGWLLNSSGHVRSHDIRHHVAWLLARIEPSAAPLVALQAAGAKVELHAFWESASGQGGPTLFPSQMKRLSELGIDVEWDFRFPEAWVEVRLTPATGARLLITASNEGFESTGYRLRAGFEERLTGPECTLRLVGRGDASGLSVSADSSLFTWQMSREEVTAVSEVFLSLARSAQGQPAREITPRINATGTRVFASPHAFGPGERQQPWDGLDAWGE